MFIKDITGIAWLSSVRVLKSRIKFPKRTQPTFIQYNILYYLYLVLYIQTHSIYCVFIKVIIIHNYMNNFALRGMSIFTHALLFPVR